MIEGGVSALRRRDMWRTVVAAVVLWSYRVTELPVGMGFPLGSVLLASFILWLPTNISPALRILFTKLVPQLSAMSDPFQWRHYICDVAILRPAHRPTTEGARVNESIIKHNICTWHEYRSDLLKCVPNINSELSVRRDFESWCRTYSTKIGWLI